MGALTGLDLLAWAVLGGVLLGLLLLATAWAPAEEPGARVASLLVVPLLAGLALLAGLVLTRWSVIASLPGALVRSVAAVVVAAGLAIVVVAVVDLLVRRVIPALERVPGIAGWSASSRRDAARVIVLGLAVVVTLAGVTRAGTPRAESWPPPDTGPGPVVTLPPTVTATPTIATPSPTVRTTRAPASAPVVVLSPAPSPAAATSPVPPTPSTRPVATIDATAPGVLAIAPNAAAVPPFFGPVEHVERYPLPGQPMAIVSAGARTGYISLRMGGILWFRVPAADGEPLLARRVAEDVINGRGIAIRDGVLYVVELGAFPCPGDPDLCEGPNAGMATVSQGELAILSAMRARILAFDIAADGTLAGRRTVVEDLPVVDSLHAGSARSCASTGPERGPSWWQTACATSTAWRSTRTAASGASTTTA